jgi:DnaJ domain
MDPYVTLGVPRGCTRDEVRDAFRTLVRRAHPDHGGEDRSFVHLRAAYEQILQELDRRTYPVQGVPGVFPRDHRPRESPDPRVARSTYIAWLDRAAKKSMRRQDRWPWRLFNAIGVTFLLIIIVSSIVSVPLIFHQENLREQRARRIARYGQSTGRSSDSVPGPSKLPDSVPAPSSPSRVRKAARIRIGEVFVIPYDSTLFLTAVGGSAGGDSEFGLGRSEADHQPVFTGLPNHPSPTGEVRIGHVRKGSKLPMYVKSQGAWDFAESGPGREETDTFRDQDNSLGKNGSIVEQTGPKTWILHLDDAGSGDDDVLIRIRLEPDSPSVPRP